MAATAAAFNTNEVVKNFQDQASKASAEVTKAVDEMTKVNKDALDAFVKSSEIVFKGAEDAAKRAQAYVKTSVESAVAASKDLIGCKNINEVMDLQANFARKAYDAAVVESTAISELNVKVANEAFAPLQKSFTTVVEKATPAVAKK